MPKGIAVRARSSWAVRKDRACVIETGDACIYFLYQLDGKHVVTVEGLGPSGGDLHPVQAAMVDYHGSQCGYCTPGFVMALAGHFESGEANGPASLRTALTGNLCRCTGYLSILEAGALITPKQFPPLAELHRISAAGRPSGRKCSRFSWRPQAARQAWDQSDARSSPRGHWKMPSNSRRATRKR